VTHSATIVSLHICSFAKTVFQVDVNTHSNYKKLITSLIQSILEPFLRKLAERLFDQCSRPARWWLSSAKVRQSCDCVVNSYVFGNELRDILALSTVVLLISCVVIFLSSWVSFSATSLLAASLAMTLLSRTLSDVVDVVVTHSAVLATRAAYSISSTVVGWTRVTCASNCGRRPRCIA